MLGLTPITYGNGRVLNRTYDQDYVVSSVLDAGSGGLDLAFGRDVIGNLTRVQTGATGNTFEYDGLNRLTHVNDLNQALISAYTYDATGNRKSKQVGGSAQMYTYPLDSHHLIDVAGAARSYDAAGPLLRVMRSRHSHFHVHHNTTAIGANAKSFMYNDTGRMSAMNNAGVLAKSYMVNARGERVRKYRGTVTAENQYTVYDESGHVLGDYDDTLAPIRELIWLDNLPVGVLSGSTGTLAYIEPDHLGTPRTAIDATRNVAVWTWSPLNDAFGESVPSQDPDADGKAFVFNLRMPGQVWDAESGLSYNYFRDYDSTSGRAIESDPLGLRGGISTYAMLGGNPLRYIDPLGLEYFGPNYSQNMRAMGEADAEAWNQDAAAMSAAMKRVRCLVAQDYANTSSPTDAFSKAQRDKMNPSQFPGYTNFDLTAAEHYIMAYNWSNSGIGGGPGGPGVSDVALPFATPVYEGIKLITVPLGHGPFHTAGQPSMEEMAAGWAGWADAVQGNGAGAGGGAGCGCH